METDGVIIALLCKRQGQIVLFVFNMKTAESQLTALPEGRVYCISKDCKYIGSFHDNVFYVMRTMTGQYVDVGQPNFSLSSQKVTTMVFTTDSQYLAVGSNLGKIYIYEVAP